MCVCVYVLQENSAPPSPGSPADLFFMYDKLFRAYVKCLMYFPSYCFSGSWTFILGWEYVALEVQGGGFCLRFDIY